MKTSTQTDLAPRTSVQPQKPFPGNSISLTLKGARLLQPAKKDGRGNLIFLVRKGDRKYCLKLYGRRESILREAFKKFSYRFIEHKSGVTPRERSRIEKAALSTWSRHGFEVPRIVNMPLPEGIRPPATWFSFYEGARLSDILSSTETPKDVKLNLTSRVASELCNRQQLALKHMDPMLIHEHSALKHIVVSGDKLIHFDFEHAYRPRYPIMDALARELSGYVKSLTRQRAEDFEELISAFVEGYENAKLLQRLALHGVYGRGIIHELRRYADRSRHPASSKTDGLRRLLERIQKDG